MNSGVVTIIGRPSAGKSTFLNTASGEKVSIVSAIPQTTRNAIRGIVNTTKGQIVFIDTPGYHKSEKKLNLKLQEIAKTRLEEGDAVLYLIDLSREFGEEEKNICLIHLDKNDSYLLFSNNNVIIQPIEMNFKLYEMLDPDAKEQEVMRLINEINYFFLTLQEPKIIYTSGLFVKYPEIKAYTQLKFSTRFILEDIDSVLSLNIKYSGNFPIQIYNTSISLAYRGLE